MDHVIPRIRCQVMQVGAHIHKWLPPAQAGRAEIAVPRASSWAAGTGGASAFLAASALAWQQQQQEQQPRLAFGGAGSDPLPEVHSFSLPAGCEHPRTTVQPI